MHKQALSMISLGLGLAGGITLVLSCNLGRESKASESSSRMSQHRGGEEQGKEHAREEDEENEGDEASIQLADAPAPVRMAILKLTSEKSISKIMRESDEGMTAFEVEYTEGGAESSALLTDQGVVMELEKSVDKDSLPPAAMKAVMKHRPNATVKKAVSVQAFFYEVELSVDGKDRAVKVHANGQVEEEEEE